MSFIFPRKKVHQFSAGVHRPHLRKIKPLICTSKKALKETINYFCFERDGKMFDIWKSHKKLPETLLERDRALKAI